MEPKIGTAIKRVVTVTIIDQDVDNLEEILRHFAKESTHKDRRLIGFAKRFLDKINEQRRQIRLLEYEDQKAAMKEFFADLDEERLSEVEGQQGEQILTLTDVVDKEELPQIEDAATK
jgi:molybdopterin/thiamine biosynthesis adenylyltransferase